MKIRVLRHLRRVNLMHFVCDHLFGEDHTHRHRMVCGFVVMWVGVIVASFASDFHVEHVKSVADCGVVACHYGLDVLGYFIHGAGAVPFVETATAMLLVAAPAEDGQK